jgi:hypothetical protein
MERIIDLNSNLKDSLKALLYGNIPNLPVSYPLGLCKKLSEIIEYLSVSEYDINNEDLQFFLRKSLPKLVEVLIRRQSTRWEHEAYIFKTLQNIICFLYLPLSQDTTELCELRNIMLVSRLYSGSTYILLDADELPSSNQEIYEGLRLFYDCGKPNNISSSSSDSSSLIYFWPDEWEQVLAGDKAVGHGIQFYVTLNWQADATWLTGIVTAYDSKEDLHFIQIDSNSVEKVLNM